RHAREIGQVDSRLKCNPVFEFAEYFVWGVEVEAFAGRAVVSRCDGIEVILGDYGEVGFSGQRAAQSADGVFDAAFLPGRVRIAEESLKAAWNGEFVVQCELGTVVEGDGAAERARQAAEQPA